MLITILISAAVSFVAAMIVVKMCFRSIDRCHSSGAQNVCQAATEAPNERPHQRIGAVCRECDNYILALRELRRQCITKFAKYIAVLIFTGALAIAFDSYIPCLFLFLLLL